MDSIRGGLTPAIPFVGIIESTHDALICFEAARRSIIPRITRRLLETEKASLISSGAVFVFDEKESQIKRWTDGLIIWSPSRILSNFLIYRETTARTDRHHPNVNSSSRKRTNSNSPTNFSCEDILDEDVKKEQLVAPRRRVKGGGWTGPVEGASEQERERELVGSLTSTYKFKPDGLIKKTISVSIDGVAQHLVNYYTMEDALSGRLRSPSSFPELASLAIHPDFLSPTHFRFPPRVEIDDKGITRYRESDESIPPPRTIFVAMASVSPDQSPKPPKFPRQRSNSFPPTGNIKALLVSSPLSQVVTDSGSYFPPTNLHPPSFNIPPNQQTYYIPHPPISFEPSYQPRGPSQPRRRSSPSELDASSPPQSESWNSLPSKQASSHDASSFRYASSSQDTGNKNGKRDRETWSEQQFQPTRPCFVTQNSTDSYSHLGYSLPSPSHRPATLFYLTSASPQPLLANQRFAEAVPTSLFLSNSTNTTPSEPPLNSPPFSYASSSAPSSYQESHLSHQYYQTSPPSHSTHPLPGWTSNSSHLSSFDQGRVIGDVYAQQAGEGWGVPSGLMRGEGGEGELRKGGGARDQQDMGFLGARCTG